MDIVTINVRGLHNATKRQTLFNWLDSRKFEVICLQETFCTSTNIHTLNSEWNGQGFHCVSNSSHSKGVSILINNKLQFKLINHITCDDGRKQILNFKSNSQTFSIANVYAPTEANYRKDFFIKTRKWIIENAANHNCLIVAGDFNCSVADIDRKFPNIDRSRPVFKDFIKYIDVIDTFRSLNKSKVCYTYSNSSKTVQSRIDYILCSPYINNLAKKGYVLNPPRIPDHKAVIIKLRPEIISGKGYWKLNTSLLQNEDYIIQKKKK